MNEVKPITRASFIEAYADAHPGHFCASVVYAWDALHDRAVQPDEIDEDP